MHPLPFTKYSSWHRKYYTTYPGFGFDISVEIRKDLRNGSRF